jgi:hypothetical protein
LKDVLLAARELAGCQHVDFRPIDGAIEREIEVLERLASMEEIL